MASAAASADSYASGNIGDSCDRPGGFFCVPSVRAATRAEAGAPIG